MKHNISCMVNPIAMMLICTTVGLSDETQRTTPEYVKVDVQGTMTQVMAIGGETTGIMITANGISWELDLAHDRELGKAASKLFDKQVRVTGGLNVRRGVEIPKRWIVDVKTLEPASGNSGYLVDGKLAQSLVLKDAQGGFAGFSGHIWTIESDGSWTRQRFLNERVEGADQQGKLSKQQMDRLADVLAEQDLLGVPDRLGKPVGANPHIFSMTFGEKQSSFTVQPGASLPSSKDSQSPEARFAMIANQILKLAKATSE